MSLFRQTAKWSLRALLLWGAIELGAELYARGLEHTGAARRLVGQEAMMARLDESARAGEEAAAREEAALATLVGDAWSLAVGADEPLARAAARSLREELMALGAEAPVVDVEEAAEQGELSRVTLTARWREPVELSPRVLSELAQRHPELRVERLALQRDSLVGAELVVRVAVRARPRQEASR